MNSLSSKAVADFHHGLDGSSRRCCSIASLELRASEAIERGEHLLRGTHLEVEQFAGFAALLLAQASARNRKPFLLQTYRRDMGGLRLAYKF